MMMMGVVVAMRDVRAGDRGSQMGLRPTKEDPRRAAMRA